MNARNRGIARLVPGVLVMGLGIWVLAVSAGYVDVERYAPDWIVALCGLAFLGAGVILVIHFGSERFRESKWGGRMQGWTGAVVLVSLITMSHWIAFGPGERSSESAVATPVGSFSGSSGEWTTRIAFGIGAVAFDLILIRAVIHALRNR